MAKETFWKGLGFKKLSQISFGLFASLFLLWTLFNASSFVPEGQELKFTLAFLGYGVLGAYVFAREDIRSKLSKVSLLKAVPVFLVVLLVSFFLLSLLLGIRDPLPEILITTLIGVPLYLQMINALVFATVESSFFQAFLDGKIGILGSVIVAGVFHMFIWSGSLLFNFLGASLLFLVFSTVYFYSKRVVGPVMAVVVVIAFHTAYNLVKYKIAFGV